MSDPEAPPRSSPSPSKGEKGERRRRKQRVRRPAARGKASPKAARRAGFALFVACGLAVAALSTYVLVIFPRAAGPGSGRDVELVVPMDATVGALVDDLDRAGLLRSRGTFALYARLVGLHAAPGRHLLTDDASGHELVSRLERLGAASKARVVIPEGWTRFDIARRLQALHVCSATAFHEAATDPGLLKELGIDGESIEGYLFPATYELALDSDPADLVRRLAVEFERRWTMLEQNHRLGRAQLESTLLWSRREIVTLASMIEKEAAVDEERPLIASVFINRLRDPTFKRKVLQCDPTAAYGCLVLRDRIPACAAFTGRVTRAINVDPANPYSTYVHEGLPPGPIANPGVKSLQAVLAPATTRHLYFVTRGDRRHAFSETLEEHNAAVEDLKRRSQRAE